MNNHDLTPVLTDPSTSTSKPESPPTTINVTLGDCRFISHITTKEDGSYECTNSAMRYFAEPINPTSSLSLRSRVQNILKQQPGRWFDHPKHLDPIIAGCLSPSVRSSSRVNLEEHILGRNVVLTWRKILTRIFVGESITLHVSLIDGILYMEEEDPRPRWRAREYAFGDAVGMAFEGAYTVTSAKSKRKGRDQAKGRIQLGGLTHIGTQWRNIVVRTLGDLNLVFCGEVDAVRDLKNNTGRETDMDFFNRRIELKCRNSKGGK
ncbi:hypothetical protein VKT23_016034 [Stygiomarasmius scandens]|uniref:RAI1-like domain-containing protein n=1 Tax=Marasmiellus scandens TaxID=2682957 RepID=A0ABR1IXR7_9AGAR